MLTDRVLTRVRLSDHVLIVKASGITVIARASGLVVAYAESSALAAFAPFASAIGDGYAVATAIANLVGQCQSEAQVYAVLTALFDIASKAQGTSGARGVFTAAADFTAYSNGVSVSYTMMTGASSGPTIYLHDTFAGTPGANVVGRTPDTVGTNTWQDTSGGGWTSDYMLAHNGVSGEDVAVRNTTGGAHHFTTYDVGHADSVMTEIWVTGSPVCFPQIIFRANSATNRFYIVQHPTSGAPTLYYWDGGAFGTAASGSGGGFPASATTTVELTLSGANVTYKVNGATRLTSSAATNNTGNTYVGFGEYDNNDSTNKPEVDEITVTS